MNKLQPGDILICIVESTSVFDASDKNICKIIRDEYVTFIKYSSYRSSEEYGQPDRWIEILTTENIVGDVDIFFLERAIK